jgi:hypothetical protein
MCRCDSFLAALVLSALSIIASAADKATKPSSPDGPTSPASSSISGVVYKTHDVPSVNPRMKKQVTLCYKLTAVDRSIVQPFILEPTSSLGLPCPPPEAEINNNSSDADERAQCNAQRRTWSPVCSTVDEKHPLLSGSHLVVVVDPTHVPDTSSLKSLIFNVSSQQGAPINSAPVRPIFAAAAGAAESLTSPWFLTWPFALVGDTVPTVTVSGLFRATEAAATDSATASTPLSPPTDQVVTLLSIPFPQVHPLYYYDVSTGVIASTLRNPSFFRVR